MSLEPKAKEMLDVIITQLFVETSEDFINNEFYNELDMTPHNFREKWLQRIDKEIIESFNRVVKAVEKRRNESNPR